MDKPVIYAGIGARELPAELYGTLINIGRRAARKGWILRSGAAGGADTAFETGASNENGAMEIYLPWSGFHDHTNHLLDVSPEAMALAAKYHGDWTRLNNAGRKLHGRNAYQIMGADLATPADLVICWTADGCVHHDRRTRNTGGTGTAISIASMAGIPVYNIQRPADLAAIRVLLNS